MEVVAFWFLLRGIENVACSDVVLRRDPRAVRLRLPVSKTDVEGKGCERAHACICRPRHRDGFAAPQLPVRQGRAHKKTYKSDHAGKLVQTAKTAVCAEHVALAALARAAHLDLGISARGAPKS